MIESLRQFMLGTLGLWVAIACFVIVRTWPKTETPIHKEPK